MLPTGFTELSPIGLDPWAAEAGYNLKPLSCSIAVELLLPGQLYFRQKAFKVGLGLRV